MIQYQPSDVHVTDAPYVHETDAVGIHSKEYKGEADSKFEGQLIKTFDFPQKLIPLDEAGTLLRLWEPLKLKVDALDSTFYIDEWDIKMSCDNVHLLPERIARKFMVFFGKAETGQMSVKEEQRWVKILDTIDYQHFCINRAPSHYMEGKLVSKTPDTKIEWNDGSPVERFPFKIAAALSLLEPGDEFSAYCKLGINNEIKSIERVTLLAS